MRNWTFTLQDKSQVTVWEHAISCVHWAYDEHSLHGPDRCRVMLTNGQSIDLLRDNTRLLYQDFVTEIQ